MANAIWSRLLWQNYADFTAMNNQNTEKTLLAGVNDQPWIERGYMLGNKGRRGLRLTASGVYGTTGTPTLIFQARMSSTPGSATLSGTSIGVSTTLTLPNNAANGWWELELNLIGYTPGIGTGNAMVSCDGKVIMENGAALLFSPLEISTPDTATWGATYDASLDQWFNLSATWGTQNPSNTITCKRLRLEGLD